MQASQWNIFKNPMNSIYIRKLSGGYNRVKTTPAQQQIFIQVCTGCSGERAPLKYMKLHLRSLLGILRSPSK